MVWQLTLKGTETIFIVHMDNSRQFLMVALQLGTHWRMLYWHSLGDQINLLPWSSFVTEWEGAT